MFHRGEAELIVCVCGGGGVRVCVCMGVVCVFVSFPFLLDSFFAFFVLLRVLYKHISWQKNKLYQTLREQFHKFTNDRTWSRHAIPQDDIADRLGKQYGNWQRK